MIRIAISFMNNCIFSLTQCKPKILKTILLIIALTLITWLYWYSKEYNNFHNENYLTMKRYKYNRYYINEHILQPSPNICLKSLRLVIIVTSYIGHVELRSAHRKAMPNDMLEALNTIRIFLLARIPETEKSITQEAVKDENNIYGDILQGNFDEHYRNLTHKHLMGLKWASERCSNATFILKLDDDMVFNLNKTYEYLPKLHNLDRENLLIGHVFEHFVVKREEQNKWYVSWDEYSKPEYPPYLSGWYYITTPETARRLANEATYHPYFWIDDVFVTGIITEALNIHLKHLPEDFFIFYYEVVECCITNMIKKNIKCDSVVGPNGNRNDLIVIFNSALRYCVNSDKCREPTNKPKCMVMKDRAIFSDGQAVIQPVKV